MKKVTEEVLTIRNIINNVSENNYNIQDYKMCKKEADIVCKALKFYLADVQFEGINLM